MGIPLAATIHESRAFRQLLARLFLPMALHLM
jgi:hypothetical protein